LSIDIIAEKLGRHRSTIFREVRRNVYIDKEWPELSRYHCVTAHDMACERRTKLRKLVRFSHVRQSVIERIMHGWSPQQIAGRMRLERHLISVSHETIYKFAIRRTNTPSSSGDTCWNIVHDAGRAMPDAGMASASARISTSCAARMSSPTASSSDTGNATSSSFAKSSARRT